MYSLHLHNATTGMQREKSASATAMRMSDVLFGFLWQGLFTSDGVHYLSLLGAFMISSSIVVIVAFKQLEPDARNTSGSLLSLSATDKTLRTHQKYAKVQTNDGVEQDLSEDSDFDSDHENNKFSTHSIEGDDGDVELARVSTRSVLQQPLNNNDNINSNRDHSERTNINSNSDSCRSISNPILQQKSAVMQ